MHLRPKDGFLSPDASNVGTEVLWNAPRRRHTATSSSTDGDLQSRFPEARWKKSPKCYGNRPKLAGKHTEVGWKTVPEACRNNSRSQMEQIPKLVGKKCPISLIYSVGCTKPMYLTDFTVLVFYSILINSNTPARSSG